MRRRSGILLALALAVCAALVTAAPVAGHDRDGDGRLPDSIALPNGWSPEGIAAGFGRSIFVGSLVDGAIWKGDVATGRGQVFVPGVTGDVAVGLEFDAWRNRLWVAGGGTGEVRAYDARTGRLLKTYTFSPAGFLNDLVVTPWAVYVTDSMRQQLDVIPLGLFGRLPDPSRVRTLPLTGEIEFVAGQFNANGIESFGPWLIVVQSNTGQLFKVHPRTGVATEIDLLGTGATARFGDGLLRLGLALYVVRNQAEVVSVFKLDWRLRSARFVGDLTSRLLDIPTTVAFQEGKLWAANARFGTPVTPDTTYSVTKLPLRP